MADNNTLQVIKDLERRLAETEAKLKQAEARAQKLQSQVDKFDGVNSDISAKIKTKKPKTKVKNKKYKLRPIPPTQPKTPPKTPKATKPKRPKALPKAKKINALKDILEDYRSVLGQKGVGYQINEILESDNWDELEQYILSSNWMKALVDEFDGYVPTNGTNMPSEGYYKMQDLIQSLYDSLDERNLL